MGEIHGDSPGTGLVTVIFTRLALALVLKDQN